MTFKNLLDQHTHTDHSFDGHHSVVFLCETAVEKGLRAVSFTDHVEMDVYREEKYDRAALQSFAKTVKARSAFRGQLIVCAGVELGEPTYNLSEAETLVHQYSYDVVVGSIHNLRGQKDFWFLDYPSLSDEDIAAALRQYFDELLLLAQWGSFDILAHMTYPLRYICGDHHRAVRMEDYAEQTDAILETIVRQRISLEINASGLRQKLGETMPNETLLRRYKELGGEMITIGSDAHYAEDLGAGLPAAMDLALRCGFTHMQLYQAREPMPIEIN